MPPQSDVDSFRPFASLETLRKRAKILFEIRTFFHRQQYWEVETPLLGSESVIDEHLEPFIVPAGRCNSADRYLQTSPELAMKRLLASGADRIYQICKAFRKEEQGTLHNPEFTMLEWYACGQTEQQQIDFTEKLIQHLYAQAKKKLPASLLRLTYEEAFRETLGVSIFDLDTNQLQELARSHEINFPEAGCTKTNETELSQRCERDLLLNLLLTEKVEPFLKKQQAVFLHNYPASQAALATIPESDSRIAQRFELYLEGIEICNGYNELTDANELEKRCHEQNRLRQANGLQTVPQPKRFIAAMKNGLPPCSGVALGIDRLVMLLLGCQSIKQVLAFPHEQA